MEIGDPLSQQKFGSIKVSKVMGLIYNQFFANNEINMFMKLAGLTAFKMSSQSG
jgi:hypothetical protein